MCNLLQPDMRIVITGTLKNLDPAFKRLFKEPIKGRRQRSSNSATLLTSLEQGGGCRGGLDGWRR